MKPVSKMAIVGAVAVIAGASAMEVLHAQTVTAPAPAYLVANVEEVKDDAMLAQYAVAVPKTEAAFGGHVIVRGAMPVMLDSSPLPKGRFVVIQFPSMKALQGWWNSPAYSAVRPLREKSTVGRVFALEGIPPP
jgi:uncharacterized protein (DUF1330 family)